MSYKSKSAKFSEKFNSIVTEREIALGASWGALKLKFMTDCTLDGVVITILPSKGSLSAKVDFDIHLTDNYWGMNSTAAAKMSCDIDADSVNFEKQIETVKLFTAFSSDEIDEIKAELDKGLSLYDIEPDLYELLAQLYVLSTFPSAENPEAVKKLAEDEYGGWADVQRDRDNFF